MDYFHQIHSLEKRDNFFLFQKRRERRERERERREREREEDESSKEILSLLDF